MIDMKFSCIRARNFFHKVEGGHVNVDSAKQKMKNGKSGRVPFKSFAAVSLVVDVIVKKGEY